MWRPPKEWLKIRPGYDIMGLYSTGSGQINQFWEQKTLEMPPGL